MGRRVVPWLVAAVVTVALVAGGMLVAGNGGGRSPAVLPELDLGGSEEGFRIDLARTDKAGQVRPYDIGDAPTPWPPVTYRRKGPLPALPDRARAWRVGDDAGAGRVAVLAGALGLRGRPREDPGGWTVTDGGRSLRVNRLAGMPWTYGSGVPGGCVARRGGGPYRPGGGLQCLDADTSVSGRPTSPPVTARPVAPARPPRPADRPSRELAERVARELAARAGLELDGAAVRVADSYAARLVTISPAVGGLPTSGFSWTAVVGAGGRIRQASGWLATPEPADTYPLIGVEEGFRRLQRSPPIRVLRPAAGPAVEARPCPATAKVPCAERPLPARVATVTGVRLGLRLAPAATSGGRPGGVAYLLPAYLFDLEGGWTDVRAIVAVQERYLTRP